MTLFSGSNGGTTKSSELVPILFSAKKNSPDFNREMIQLYFSDVTYLGEMLL
jgi:hypothetical protein